MIWLVLFLLLVVLAYVHEMQTRLLRLQADLRAAHEHLKQLRALAGGIEFMLDREIERAGGRQGSAWREHVESWRLDHPSAS